MSGSCTLCDLPTPPNSEFCCLGCQSVYQILSSQDNLEDVKSHPLFQEALRSGVISNPTLLEEAAQEPSGPVEKICFEIEQMWCTSCALAIQMILRRQKGITTATIDYATDIAVVEFDPKQIGREKVFSLISKLGYRPKTFASGEPKKWGLWLRFSVAAFCLLNLMMAAYPLYTKHLSHEGFSNVLGIASFFFSLPLLLYVALPLWRRLLLAFRTGLFGMETLVLLSTTSAFAYSTYQLASGQTDKLYFDSMGMILFFVLLGKLFETKAKRSAQTSLWQLTRTLPKKGFKEISPDQFASVEIEKIAVGDILRVRAGEKVVLDGVITQGSGFCDESLMTGEARLVSKHRDNQLVAGSILIKGELLMRVEKSASDTLLAKIVDAIGVNTSSKRPFAEKLIAPFTLLVILLALFAPTFERALCVLLIACPCAIGIARPLALTLLVGEYAKRGIFVRNRDKLLFLAKKPFFVFDKTGTLTQGTFSITQGLEAIADEDKPILKALCQKSTHPIACAIEERLLCPAAPLDQAQQITARGVRAFYQGKSVSLGSHRFMQEQGFEAQTPHCEQIYFGKEKIYALQLEDELREALPQQIDLILSGDHTAAVASLAKRVGCTSFQALCDPLEKKAKIESLQAEGKCVVMVGDGINDGPALSAADVGICMKSGSALSHQVASLVLAEDRLDRLDQLRPLARRTERIINQNFICSFAYNFLGIIAALCGLLTPLMAALIMTSSSLLVLGNSLRVKTKF